MAAMRNIWVVFCIVLAWAAPALADSHVGTPHVQIHLAVDKAAVAPGDTVTVALDQDILSGWHLYWRNPGDSGIAPSMQWKLPQDYTVSAILWPPPSRLAFGPLVNFGYADHVTLLTDIKVPADATIGNPAVLTTALSWLVCQETCIPESATLDISVPVEAESRIDPATADLFFRTRHSIPSAAPFTADLTSDPKVLTLTVHAPPPAAAFFYPYKPGLIDDSSPQLVEAQNGEFTLRLVRGEVRQPVSSLEGVLETYDDRGQMLEAYTLSAASAAAPPPPPINESHTGLVAALGLALIGGIILNLMPCVFPVLSLKVLAFARHAHGHEKAARRSGIAYTAGILLAFVVIAVFLIALRSAGNAIGWGFQLQSPPFVLCLCYLLFAMGLSLSGFFTVSGKFVNLGAGLAERDGLIGSFFTGMLAALVATPCSAPFMGTAIGFALTQSWPIALAIIEFLGLGLALPYLLLSYNPDWVRVLPRPGVWMERLKQLLAFPLYGSAIWLLWVLSLQTGPHGIVIALGGALLLCFALWCYNISHHVHHASWRRVFTIIAIISLVGVVSGAASPTLWQKQSEAAAGANSFIPAGWESFTPARLQELQASGTPVLVDMSAAWCITCIVNEKVALGPEVTKILAAKGVTLLKGDWTNQDKQITAYLASFGRSGVPLYVYYPAAHKAPIILPQILSRGIVLNTIAQ